LGLLSNRETGPVSIAGVEDQPIEEAFTVELMGLSSWKFV